MSHKMALEIGAALLLCGATVPASQAHELYVTYEVYDERCPDTYCGNRAYADPNILDGFRHSSGYRGRDGKDRITWYDQRQARPRTVTVRVPHRHLPDGRIYVVKPR